ncbi:MAG: hypothetical protein AB7R00_04575 [Kofleriaceae bacterium]
MALPLDYRPGMQIHHPRVTAFELAAATGERWAEIRLVDQPQSTEIHLFDPTGTTRVELPAGASATSPYVATLSVYGAIETRLLRRSRPRRTTIGGQSRLQADLTLALRTQRTTRWRVPEPTAAADQISIHTEAGRPCATLSFELERRCVSLLDPAGNPRIVMSTDPQPAWDGERFRGVISSGTDHETMLYLVVIDGAVPPGETREFLMP